MAGNGEDLFRDIRDAMREVKDELALTREEVTRSRESHEDMRQFVREITIRNERVHREVLEGFGGVKDALREMRGEICAHAAEIRAHAEETRAQTRAIFKVLDRMPPEPGNAAAG